MSNEIKAPVIEGWEICSHEEFRAATVSNTANVRINRSFFYYKRSKPKEKSIREIIQEELKLWSHSNRDLFANAFERILENYVKKEG